MSFKVKIKDPDDFIDFSWDWSDWLASGDTIAESEFGILNPPDANLLLMQQTHDDTSARVWLMSGTENVAYNVYNRITTVQGRTKDKTITFEVAHE